MKEIKIYSSSLEITKKFKHSFKYYEVSQFELGIAASDLNISKLLKIIKAKCFNFICFLHRRINFKLVAIF